MIEQTVEDLTPLEQERSTVQAEFHSERFVDAAPEQVSATLLDEGRYLASPRTMYRILDEAGEVTERRNQRVHPTYSKPEPSLPT